MNFNHEKLIKMKTNVRNYLLTALLVVPVLFSSCDKGVIGISGDGEIVEATLDVRDFDGFVNNIAADIYVTQGDEFSVVIEAQENIIDNLNIDEVDNGIWTIKYYRMVRWAKDVKIYITMPELTKARINGSGDIVGENAFNGMDKLKLTIAGSGKINLEAYAEEVDLKIIGSGDIYLVGECDFLDCSISGSGGIHAFKMLAGEAGINVSGSGSN